ncbi:MAG TPA: tautomerase family protein [Gaiellaceae bacterium]|nr:tautomerase family protein [Gaiellaceae bacterium]
MPVIEVKLYDTRVTEESVPKMIEALTDALHESSGAAKERIHVIVQAACRRSTGVKEASPGRNAEARLSAGFVGETSGCSQTTDTRRSV